MDREMTPAPSSPVNGGQDGVGWDEFPQRLRTFQSIEQYAGITPARTDQTNQALSGANVNGIAIQFFRQFAVAINLE
jgi:hypothetical protein